VPWYAADMTINAGDVLMALGTPEHLAALAEEAALEAIGVTRDRPAPSRPAWLRH